MKVLLEANEHTALNGIKRIDGGWVAKRGPFVSICRGVGSKRRAIEIAGTNRQLSA